MSLYKSKKTDDYKEGLKDGVQSTEKKIKEIQKQNKQAETYLINSIDNLSEINDIILEKMSDDEKKLLYGLNQNTNIFYDFGNDDLNRFVLGFINFLSSEIYKENELTEYQKKFIEIMQKITGVAIISEEISYKYLSNIEELQDNMFILNIICDFLLLGNEEISNQLLNKIGIEINMSNRLKEDILKYKKEVKDKYGNRLILLQYLIIVEDTEVNGVLHDKTNIEVNENELHELLKYWKPILDYFCEKENFVCITNTDNIEIKHRVTRRIKKLEDQNLGKEFKPNDVVAYSDFFILSKEKFYIYPDIIIKFSEIVNYKLDENYVQLFKDNYLKNSSEINNNAEVELYIELKEEVIQFPESLQFSNSLDTPNETIFLIFLFNLLNLLLKQEPISKEENTLSILAVYCDYHLYKNCYEFVNEKNVYLKMEISFKNIKELKIQKKHDEPLSSLLGSKPFTSRIANPIAKQIDKQIEKKSTKRTINQVDKRKEQRFRFDKTPDTILINTDGLYINKNLEFTLDQLKASTISSEYIYTPLKLNEKDRVCKSTIYHEKVGKKYLYCENKNLVMYTNESSLKGMTELIKLFILLLTN